MKEDKNCIKLSNGKRIKIINNGNNIDLEYYQLSLPEKFLCRICELNYNDLINLTISILKEAKKIK